MLNRLKHWFILLGFLLFLGGMLGFIVNLVGLHLQIFAWVDSLGFLVATIIKATMIIVGISLVYLLQFNPDEPD